MTDVGSWSLKEFPELAMMRTITLKTKILQRLAHLHSRQTHLSAESGHDVGGSEIDGVLVLLGLAIAGGDEFAGDVRRLIRAVETVETGNLVGVKPIAEACVEKMTNLGIYSGIVDGGLPGIVDMIHLEDKPTAVARVVGEELHVIARGTEGCHVGQAHLAAAIEWAILDKGLRRHRLELVDLLSPHTVNLLHVDEHVLG